MEGDVRTGKCMGWTSRSGGPGGRNRLVWGTGSQGWWGRSGLGVGLSRCSGKYLYLSVHRSRFQPQLFPESQNVSPPLPSPVPQLVNWRMG